MSHCKYWLVVVCLLGLSGCTTENRSQPNRIGTREWQHLGGRTVYIIEVDGVEYIVHSGGGILKHER
jgi:hypothetical protein